MRSLIALCLLLLPLIANAEVLTIAVIGDTQNGTKCDEPSTAWAHTVEMVNWLSDLDIGYAVFLGDLTNGRTWDPDCWCAAQTYGGACTDLTNPYTGGQCQTGECNDSDASACIGGDGEASSTGGHNCEWTRMRTLVETLETAGIPWAAVAGNHDQYGWAFEEYNSFFGEGRLTSNVLEQGSFTDSIGDNVQSTSFYNVFSGAGIQWLHIGVGASQLGLYTVPATVAWVTQVIDAHPKMPTLITAHQVIDVAAQCGSPVETYWCGEGTTIFQDWATNPQVFLAIGGHIRDVVHITTTTPAGVKLIGMAVDWSYRLVTTPATPAWQDEESPNNGGGGVVALLDIDPVAGTISMRSYSPEAGEFDERYEDDGDETQATFWTEHLQFCGASRFTLPDAACADYVKPMAPRRIRDRQHGAVRGSAY